MSANITCLQDVHLTQKEEDNLKIITKCDCYISGNRTNARGVAIIFKNNFAYNILNVIRDSEGNFIIVDFEVSDLSIRLINIYAPNTDSPHFFTKIRSFVEDNEQDYIVNCGDFNLVLDPILDCKNYVNINNPRARNILLETMKIYNLVDTFRYFHPDVHRYTWRRKNPIKQARLDYVLTSKSFVDLITSTRIVPGYKSDHSISEMNILINKFKRGRGVWKLNCDLLKDIAYVNMIIIL